MPLSVVEKKQIFGLSVGLDGKRRVSKAEFETRFRGGQQSPSSLVVQILSEAFDLRDEEAVEAALLIGFVFGFPREADPWLIKLAYQEWHISHEDLASQLEEVADPKTVAALYHLSTWTPGYLEFDDARALAVKAVWSLGKLGTLEAQDALFKIAATETGRVRSLAVKKGFRIDALRYMRLLAARVFSG